MKMICKNCIFYKAAEEEEIQECHESQESYGYCHESPPTRTITENETVWPVVFEIDYCGRFMNSIEICFGDIMTGITSVVYTRKISPNQDENKENI